MNDLWIYRLNDSVWTWMSGSSVPEESGGQYGAQGVPSKLNSPGPRISSSSWYDSTKRELWLFGGYGFASSLSAAGAIRTPN